MFNNNYLTEDNFTVNLKKIEQNILYIQKRIYAFSKKCELSTVHCIQTRFIKNRQYNIFFIQQVIKQIKKYFYVYNSYYWKILIHTYLSINVKNKKSSFIDYIKKKAEQNVVIVLLDPEWNARYEQFVYIKQSQIYCSKLNTKTKQIFRSLAKSPKYIEKIYIDICTNARFISSEYCIKKIQSIKLVSKKLKILLNLNNTYEASCRLCELLKKILCTGLEWQVYINFKVKAMYKQLTLIDQNHVSFMQNCKVTDVKIAIAVFLKNLDINLDHIKYEKQNIFNRTVIFKDFALSIKSNRVTLTRVSNNSIKILLSRIRSILYHKNSINQWRLNRYLTPTIAKSRIQNILFNWYQKNGSLVDTTEICRINKIFNQVFYTWQLKK